MKYLSALILLAVFIIFLNSGCTGDHSPLAYIPDNTAVAISSQKLENLDSIDRVVNLIPPKGRPYQLLNIIEQLNLKKLLAGQSTLLVPDRESVMLMIKIPKFLSDNELFEQVESQFGTSMETFNYKGVELYKAGGKDGFFFKIYKGLFLLSTQAYPIEAVLDQKKNKGVSQKAEIVNRGKFSIHVTPEMLSTLYSGYLTPAGKAVFRQLGETYDQFVLTFPEKDSLLIEGKASLKSSVQSSETHISAEQQLRLLEQIPGRVGQMAIKPVKTLITSNDFETYVLPWVDSHYAIIVKAEETGLEEQMVIFPVRDKGNVEESITNLLENFSLGQPISHGMFSIIPLGRTDLWDYSGTGDSSVNNSYLVRMDDFVLFAKTISGLRLFLDDIVVGNTMIRNQDVLEMISKEEKHSDRLWYSASYFNSALFNDNGLSDALGEYDISVLTNLTEQVKDGFNLILSLQQISEDNRFAGQKAWSTQLPATGRSAAFIIKDKILLQGENNAVYCLNSEDGQIMWELRLSAPILGQIQSSVFNNQEVLFFNTDSELIGIDMSGNFLPGFPWQISETATQPLTIIDFQNNQRFAFLLPCGQKIFGFEMTGEPLEGWSPLELSYPVLFPFQHFQSQQQDYLFTMDSLNQLVVLNRFGEPLYQMPAMEGEYNSGPYFQNEPGSNIPGINRIVSCNSSGKIKVVNPLGEHFNLRIPCGDNTNVQFVFSDVTGDQRKDYVAVCGYNISVSTYRELRFETHFEKSLNYELSKVFSIPGGCGNKDLIGVFSESAGQVFLLKPNGDLFPFFPLAATQPFRAILTNNCKTMTLILVNGNEVYAVR